MNIFDTKFPEFIVNNNSFSSHLTVISEPRQALKAYIQFCQTKKERLELLLSCWHEIFTVDETDSRVDTVAHIAQYLTDCGFGEYEALVTNTNLVIPIRKGRHSIAWAMYYALQSFHADVSPTDPNYFPIYINSENFPISTQYDPYVASVYDKQISIQSIIDEIKLQHAMVITEIACAQAVLKRSADVSTWVRNKLNAAGYEFDHPYFDYRCEEVINSNSESDYIQCIVQDNITQGNDDITNSVVGDHTGVSPLSFLAFGPISWQGVGNIVLSVLKTVGDMFVVLGQAIWSLVKGVFEWFNETFVDPQDVYVVNSAGDGNIAQFYRVDTQTITSNDAYFDKLKELFSLSHAGDTSSVSTRTFVCDIVAQIVLSDDYTLEIKYIQSPRICNSDILTGVIEHSPYTSTNAETRVWTKSPSDLTEYGFNGTRYVVDVNKPTFGPLLTAQPNDEMATGDNDHIPYILREYGAGSRLVHFRSYELYNEITWQKPGSTYMMITPRNGELKYQIIQNDNSYYFGISLLDTIYQSYYDTTLYRRELDDESTIMKDCFVTFALLRWIQSYAAKMSGVILPYTLYEATSLWLPSGNASGQITNYSFARLFDTTNNTDGIMRCPPCWALMWFSILDVIALRNTSLMINPGLTQTNTVIGDNTSFNPSYAIKTDSENVAYAQNAGTILALGLATAVIGVGATKALRTAKLKSKAKFDAISLATGEKLLRGEKLTTNEIKELKKANRMNNFLNNSSAVIGIDAGVLSNIGTNTDAKLDSLLYAIRAEHF